MNSDKVIVINHWQEYLCYWRSETPRPQVKPAFPRWPNSYINVKEYSSQLEQYLTYEGLAFSIRDRSEFR